MKGRIHSGRLSRSLDTLPLLLRGGRVRGGNLGSPHVLRAPAVESVPARLAVHAARGFRAEAEALGRDRAGAVLALAVLALREPVERSLHLLAILGQQGDHGVVDLTIAEDLGEVRVLEVPGDDVIHTLSDVAGQA